MLGLHGLHDMSRQASPTSSSGTPAAAPASQNPRRRRRRRLASPKLDGIFRNVQSRPFAEEVTEAAFTQSGFPRRRDNQNPAPQSSGQRGFLMPLGARQPAQRFLSCRLPQVSQSPLVNALIRQNKSIKCRAASRTRDKALAALAGSSGSQGTHVWGQAAEQKPSGALRGAGGRRGVGAQRPLQTR